MDLFTGSPPHRPLLGDEIRLLILLPANFQDTITCRLKHVSLSAGHDYEALSYVWGDPKRTSPMLLDGAPYPITANLEAALRHLRHTESTRLLWVDAVCVNQLDLEERTRQISRMRDIYGQATEVVIWLGEYAPHTREQVEAAFQFANRIFQAMADGKYEQLFKEELLRTHNSEYRVLLEIIHRPWFFRVWVIQEVAVSRTPENYISGPGHPLFVCGWSSILFSRFTLPTGALQNENNRVAPEFLLNGRPNNAIWIHDLRRVRNELITGHISLAPAEQLSLFLSRGAMGFEATDERDKVYGLLGLLPPDCLPPSLQPNYTYSADRIFWEYAVYILKETKNLDILCSCSCSRPGLPSWVPDWKRGFAAGDFHLGKVSHLMFLSDNKKIEVDCMTIGRIEKVLRPINIPATFVGLLNFEFESDESAELKPGSRESISALTKAIVQVYKTLLECEEKWFGSRALDANLEPSRLHNWIAGLHAGFSGMEDSQSSLYNGLTSEELYRMLMNIRERGLGGGTEGDIWGVIEAIASYCSLIKEGLRYAMFEDNHGNFARTRNFDVLPQPGDAVCYLKGASYKFILRPENSEWRLVGTASGMFPISQEEMESQDLRIWEDFWETNKARTTRIIIH